LLRQRDGLRAVVGDGQVVPYAGGIQDERIRTRWIRAVRPGPFGEIDDSAVVRQEDVGVGLGGDIAKAPRGRRIGDDVVDR